MRQPAVLDMAGCHALMLEVRPEGEVHLVEGPGRVGDEPLAYETTMTWAASADGCRRHPRVRAFLLRILGRPTCAAVTWMDLASVDSLDLSPGSEAFPAATVDAWFEGAFPLQAHDLDDPYPRWPMDFLAHVPWLESLTLEVPASQTLLSADLLVHVPGLRDLTLKGTGLKELPAGFLAHVPMLQRLTLETPQLTALPADFLTDTPNLRVVRNPGDCAVSAPDPADRPHLLARFLDTCGKQ